MNSNQSLHYNECSTSSGFLESSTIRLCKMCLLLHSIAEKQYLDQVSLQSIRFDIDEWVDDKLTLINNQLVLMNIFTYKMVPSPHLTVPSWEGQRDTH